MTLNHVVVGSSPTVGDSEFILYHDASIVQWLEFVPSKHEVRVRFPVDAIRTIKFYIEYILLRAVGACGVMASTVDSESTDPGSNPGRPTI